MAANQKNSQKSGSTTSGKRSTSGGKASSSGGSSPGGSSGSGSGGGKQSSRERATAVGVGEAGSRYDAFEALARSRAAGEVVPLPRFLSGHDRRVHVRQTVREDHQHRITAGSDDARAKFDKLAGSLFSFFRGTSLLFYRDMAGEDAWMPTVLCLGDVHPENFGVMPSADNVPCFGSTTSTRPTTPRSPGTSCAAPSAS